MNCQNFGSLVDELARQQMMDAGVREQALAHADKCQPCGAKLADGYGLTQKLRAMASEMSGAEAPARIEDQLLAAFRQNRFTRPKRSAIHEWRYWATAVAAVLLIAVALTAMSMRTRQTIRAAENPYVPPFQPKIAANANSVTNPPETRKEDYAELAKQGTTVATRNPKRQVNSFSARSSSPNSAGTRNAANALSAARDTTVASNYGANEIATDFMPVGYTTPMNLQDGGQVMRVELPRSTLAGFGLPVNMERANEKVKADVLVGPDGQARAIRFVQ